MIQHYKILHILNQDVIISTQPLLNVHRMIEINAVGVFLFSLLKEGNNRDDILNQFKWTYGLSDLQAKRDFNTFIEKLKEAGILDHAVSLY